MPGDERQTGEVASPDTDLFTSANLLWQKKSAQIPDRDDSQIVIIDSGKKPNVCSKLETLVVEHPLGDHQPLVVRTDTFPNGMDRLTVIGRDDKVRHNYLVASVTDSREMAIFLNTAYYLRDQGVENITGVWTYPYSSRDDKSEIRETDGICGQGIASGRYTIRQLAPALSRLIEIHPHSFQTAQEAIDSQLPFLPMSLHRLLFEYIDTHGVIIPGQGKIGLHDENSVGVYPDRNGAKMRALLGSVFPSTLVSFDGLKTRLSGTSVRFADLPLKKQRLVAGKLGYVYDDVFSTGRTTEEIAEKLVSYGSLGLAIIVCHGDFTGDWHKYLQHRNIPAVYVTDSRTPMGDIDEPEFADVRSKIHVVSAASSIRAMIAADMEGRDLFTDSEYSGDIILPRAQIVDR